MSIESALAEVVDCQDACDLLLRESSKLGNALHRFLPDVNLMIYTNKLHVYFDLHNLRRELTAVTNKELDEYKTDIDDLYYSDEDDLGEGELRDRLRRFIGHLEALGDKLDSAVRYFSDLGSIPYVVKFCVQHLGIEIMFFKKDLARAGVLVV